MTASPEVGPIRPPSEAYSLLIRVTRNCPWNRCKFCRTYKEQKFSLRTVDEIKQDIVLIHSIYSKIKEFAWRSGGGGNLREAVGVVFNNPPDEGYRNVALWLYAGGASAFLQDANSLIMHTDELAEVIRFLKETFPGISRVTSYARSHTIARKKPEELIKLREAGLSRIHIGLESGYDPLLEYMEKGVTSAQHIAAGKKVVESGISLSEYVVLGLGGGKMWREHALETARVLNQINPDFIRVRTLSISAAAPLKEEVDSGRFLRSTDEEVIQEERMLIENLECQSNFVSDHITNLLQEVEGSLPQDKRIMIAMIDEFQSLSPEERLNFRLGRRMGIYGCLNDLNDARRHRMVEQVVSRLGSEGQELDESITYSLMEGFI